MTGKRERRQTREERGTRQWTRELRRERAQSGGDQTEHVRSKETIRRQASSIQGTQKLRQAKRLNASYYTSQSNYVAF